MMKSLGKNLSLGLMFFGFYFYSAIAFASLSLEQSVSDQNLEVGDQVTLKISIASDEKLIRPGAKFKPPEIKGLEYLGVSESSSTSMRITGSGRESSYKIDISINYACSQAGDFTIPAINVDVPGLGKTKKVKLKVYKELPQKLKNNRSAVAGRRRNSLSNLMKRALGLNLDDSETGKFSPEFFTEVEVDKEEVYKGEQLIASWYVYVSMGSNMETFDTLKFPTLKGFWKEDVVFVSRLNWRPFEIEGKRYMRALMSSYALTPYNEGEFILDPFELRTVMSKGYFNRTRKVLKAKSEPKIIKVKSLPSPIPETYFGGVGSLKIRSDLKRGKQEVLYGEPYLFSIRVIGDRATTKFIKAPKLDLGENFLVYDIKEEYKFFTHNVSSYKDFKYTIVPKKEGLYRLPDIKMTFLDPTKKPSEYYSEYINLETTFKVIPNKNVEKIKDEDFLKSIETPLENEVLEFLPHTNGLSLIEILYKRIPVYFELLLFLALLVVGALIYKKFSYVPTYQESLIAGLEIKVRNAAHLIEKDKAKALEELINVYSLLIGGVLGRRYGVQKEFSKSLEDLPPSLKPSESKFKNLSETMQELRFGSDLETAENRGRLQRCLTEFKELFIELRKYLR